MPIHVVRQGETVPSIANEQGIADWKTVYDDAANADLKAARPRPTILYPGDQIEVPARESKKVSGSTERRHRFRLKGEPLWLRVILKDINDEPVGNTKYTLEIGNRKWEGQTKPNGLVEHKIPLDSQNGKLTLREADNAVREVLSLKIGHLDPVDMTTGWKARLNNLGYLSGRINTVENHQSRSATEEFQCESNLLPPTGQMDGTTKSALTSKYGA